MLTEHQKHWGVDQWAAFLTAQELPCMPRSKARLLELEESLGEQLSAHDLAKRTAPNDWDTIRPRHWLP